MNNDRIYYSHDAELQAMRETTRLLVLCLMIGLGIGSMLALLFAPTSGKKVRDELSKSVGKSWDNGRDAAEPMMKRFEEEISELRKNIEERLTPA